MPARLTACQQCRSHRKRCRPSPNGCERCLRLGVPHLCDMQRVNQRNQWIDLRCGPHQKQKLQCHTQKAQQQQEQPAQHSPQQFSSLCALDQIMNAAETSMADWETNSGWNVEGTQQPSHTLSQSQPASYNSYTWPNSLNSYESFECLSNPSPAGQHSMSPDTCGLPSSPTFPDYSALNAPLTNLTLSSSEQDTIFSNFEYENTNLCQQ